MRWNSRRKLEWDQGQRRRTRFAFFTTWLDDGTAVWLQRYVVEQTPNYDPIFGGNWYTQKRLPYAVEE